MSTGGGLTVPVPAREANGPITEAWSYPDVAAQWKAPEPPPSFSIPP